MNVEDYLWIGFATGVAAALIVVYWINAFLKVRQRDKQLHEGRMEALRRLEEDEEKHDEQKPKLSSMPIKLDESRVANGYLKTVDGDYIKVDRLLGFSIKEYEKECIVRIFALFDIGSATSSGLIAVYKGEYGSINTARRNARANLDSFISFAEIRGAKCNF